MERPAHIPPKIWTMAKRSAVRFSSDAEVLRTAEMLLRLANGDEVQDEDLVMWWPGLTSKQTRIIRDALMSHDTVFDDDVSELFRLRSWFDANAQVRGELTGE